MSLLNTVNHNFTQDFFEKGDFNPLISEIFDKNKEEKFKNSSLNLEEANVDTIHLIEFVPPFFNLKFNNTKGVLSTFRYTYFNGFMCNLTSSKSLDDYMYSQLGKKKKKIVVRRLSRLEQCFNIDYKIFYGDIENEECRVLMDTFKIMIKKRFNQRGDIHSSLKNWSFYRDETAHLIRNKKACLFVIYNDKTPIAMSLNFLFNKVFESAITSYEIDFAKFGLGNIIVLKKLEWCFDNGFEFFNMRYGDYPYKRMWCNTVFKYDSYIVYKKSLGNLLKAFVILKKNQAITYAILNKDKFKALSSAMSKLKGKPIDNKPIIEAKEPVFKALSNFNEFDYKNLTPVDIKEEDYVFLRKPVFDLQYILVAKTEDIACFKFEKNIFIAKNITTSTFFKLDLN
ncbi:GNAT family N-acetyltransferase [Algibacter pectinivorans]|uniref:Acetyltransferase (GNAT) domain-containing protein n=1 Tax=Algibacter pectinivorans TaxID=870482 RepID=A0A1I1PK51_9FLAO|nr:GNAT family N-acetyltransferase [Algibacter pectinivorans]SFD07383.1 Acetyltransferase (GNAT) domain-containing protein [Algibacter pectinivorans]